METKSPLRLVGRQAGRSRPQRAEQLTLRPIPETYKRRLAWFHAPPPGNENEPGGGGSERDAPPS